MSHPRRCLGTGLLLLLPALLAGQGSGPPAAPPFNPAALTSVRGATILHVDPATGPRGELRLLVSLSAGLDSLTAILAPAAYLRSQRITLKAGDALDLAGVRVRSGDHAVLLVTDLLLGDRLVALRDRTTGAPAWGGSGTPP